VALLVWDCATSRKDTDSIPNCVTGISHWHNPSGRTIALGLTQPLTEISTRNISWGIKTAGACDWQPYHLHVPTILKSESLNLLEPSGPVQACNRIALPFIVEALVTLMRLKCYAYTSVFLVTWPTFHETWFEDYAVEEQTNAYLLISYNNLWRARYSKFW
jgi:hypothetical protein